MIIDQTVQTVLSTLAFDGHLARITAGQLERPVYARTAAVIEALGGKWTRGPQAFVFPTGSDAEELVADALTIGQVMTLREAQVKLGWFPTPDAVGDHLVEFAELAHGATILEPSAGEGALVRAILRADPKATIVCVERDPARRGVLQSNAMKRADHKRVAILDVDDIMDVTGGPSVDGVIQNPPFCKSGKGDHLDHTRHAFSMLYPRGVLASILPDSRHRGDRRHREFWNWVESRGEIRELPEGAFKSSGTMVRTVMIRVVAP